MQFSRTPCEVRRPPLFAEHAREILHEMGFSDADIETLHKDGVIELCSIDNEVNV